MLEVRDLTAAYGGIVAVRGASLNVAPGQCVALIGSNGAGKTTLLHAICGLMPPVSGSIHFRDANIAGDAAYRVARRGILLVPEGRQILAPLSVRENLELGRLALGSRPSEPYASLDAVLAVRDVQAAELERWLSTVTPDELAAPAPVPTGRGWPPYASGKSVLECMHVVLDEEWAHHGFCVRDLDRLGR